MRVAVNRSPEWLLRACYFVPITRIFPKWIRPIGFLVLVALSIAVFSPPAEAKGRQHSNTLTIYMSPDGSDFDSGNSTSTAVATLDRVRDIIETQQPTGEVDVIIKPGKYYGQEGWLDYFNGHPIRFIGNAWPRMKQQVPVFDGCPSSATCTDPKIFFFSVNTSELSQGTATNLQFEHLQIQRYTNGIEFRGNLGDPTVYLSGNQVLNCVFQDIGTAALGLTDRNGIEAIGLFNARDSVISGNTFKNVSNFDGGSSDPGSIHALYIGHYSVNNTVENNTFDTISGAAVDFRNESDNNLVQNNTFTHLSRQAVMDWYCDSNIETCPLLDGISVNECPSWFITVQGNSGTETPSSCTVYDGNTPYSCASYTVQPTVYPSGCTVPDNPVRISIDNQQM